MTASPQTVTGDDVFSSDSHRGKTEPSCPHLAFAGEKNNMSCSDRVPAVWRISRRSANGQILHFVNGGEEANLSSELSILTPSRLTCRRWTV